MADTHLQKFIQMNKATLTNNEIINHLTVQHIKSQGYSLQSILQNLRFELQQENQQEMIIDIIGIQTPVANALRRIMISQIPTMAIEDVHLYMNTSVIPDQVLAHRLGLIPILADPSYFQYKQPQQDFSPYVSICFSLHKICSRNSQGEIINQNIYSRDLIWKPLGDQLEEIGEIKPVHPDILIAKLGPGQEIQAQLYCQKGIGKTHTKWSPVCTAYYRLHPEVSLKTKVRKQEAEKIALKCPVGVFDIENSNLVVRNQRVCTSCRECIREDDSYVELQKLKDHFICKVQTVSIESTGSLTPKEILVRSIQTLKEKAGNWLEKIEEYKQTARAQQIDNDWEQSWGDQNKE